MGLFWTVFVQIYILTENSSAPSQPNGETPASSQSDTEKTAACARCRANSHKIHGIRRRDVIEYRYGCKTEGIGYNKKA